MHHCTLKQSEFLPLSGFSEIFLLIISEFCHFQTNISMVIDGHETGANEKK